MKQRRLQQPRFATRDTQEHLSSHAALAWHSASSKRCQPSRQALHPPNPAAMPCSLLAPKPFVANAPRSLTGWRRTSRPRARRRC
eukprot:1473183-Rhodomonas_salina.2